MRSRIITLVAALAAIAAASSCSAYKHYQASRPATVMELEGRLEQAGFRRVPIETPDQNGAVAQLALYQLNRYDSAKGSIFWYADPTICKCLYQGDLQAYLRYEGTLEQERDIAAYMNDTEPEQVANLGYFGESFPAPLMFGRAWPIFIVPGPIIAAPGPGGPHPIGGPGHGIFPKGGGGGIHMRGGGGHGGIHSRGGGHGHH